MTPHRVHYRTLAAHLAELPITATCADLIERITAFDGCDEAYRERLTERIKSLPKEAGWIDGLFPLCETLQEDNPRFVPAIFMDWTLADL